MYQYFNIFSFVGGLGFSEKEIGISQAVLSVVLVPVQIIFVRKVSLWVLSISI